MKIVAELPLDKVLDHCLSGGQGGMYTYNDRGDQISVKRLTQFAVHGVKCHFCGLEGDRVLVTCDNGGGLHADVYAGETMMNRDHIRPASKKGGNEVWNMRPACHKCNSKRGNEYTVEDREQYEFNRRWAQWYNYIWVINGSRDRNKFYRIFINKVAKPVTSHSTRYKIAKFFAKTFPNERNRPQNSQQHHKRHQHPNRRPTGKVVS